MSDSPDSPSIRTIFDQASELEGGERASYLDEVCLDDGMRKEVESLLAAIEDAGDFLKEPSFDSTAAFTAAVELNEGDVIDEYRILEKIGEGSNAVVFMVEQIETIRRRAAMKVIKLGMDTREVIARFEAERQALALMDHPNIAKVLNAGSTDSGRPYFIMELVKGVPITDYCDRNNLSTRERLELFTQVCLALQHAHLKGIIHRDVKPSNVMVTLHDGVPVPKVIDFGIAKATETRLTEKTLFTRFHQFIGTPAYMSPEQAEMSGLDVDTRSDIYSLGVLLYELLTGSTPFNGKELLESGYAAIQKTIREEYPEMPSTRLSTLRGDGLSAVSSNRSIEPGGLSRDIKGDLDWIVMKALEKDRTRRYVTAAEFVQDIKRHLNDEPVDASPPNRLYVMQKFVRRHRSGVIAGTAIVISLVAGILIAGMLWKRAQTEAQEAKRQTAKAEAVTELLETMFQSAGPDAAKGSDFTVRQLLNDFSRDFSGQVDLEPEVEMTVRQTVAAAYDGLGDSIQAERHALLAYELALEVFGKESSQAMKNLSRLGWLTFRLGGGQGGLEMLQSAEKYQGEHLGIDDGDYQRTLCSIGEIYAKQGKLKEAEELALRVMEATKPDQFKPNHLWVTNILAKVYRSQGRTHEAERLFDFLVENSEEETKEHPRTIEALHTVCQLQLELGHVDKAEKFANRGYEIALRTLGEPHRLTFLLMGDFAMISQMRGQKEDAINRFKEVLAKQREHLGEQRSDTIQTMLSLANLMQVEELAREASNHATGAVGAHDELSIRGLSSLAQIVAEKGQVSDARQIYERLRAISEEEYTADHEIAMQCKARLARFEGWYGNAIKADQLYLELLHRRRELHDEDDERSLDALFEYVQYLREAGRYAEALEFGNDLCKRRRALPDRPAIKLISAYRELAEVQKLRRIEAGALFYLEEAAELAESELGPKNETTLEVMLEQAELWIIREHPSRALEILEKAIPLATEELGEEDELTVQIRDSLKESRGQLNLYTEDAKAARKSYWEVMVTNKPDNLNLYRERNRFIEILAKVPEAEEESRELVEFNIKQSSEVLGKKNIYYFRSLQMRARNAHDRHQYELADKYYRELVQAQRKAGLSRHQRMLTTLYTWSETLIEQNRQDFANAIIDSWQDEIHKMQWPEEQTETIIPRRSDWRYRRYLKNQRNDWRTARSGDLPDDWKKGRTPVGYGVRGIGTMPMTDGDQRVYDTTCFHREFEIDDPTKYQSLKIRLRRENGASVFINGKVVARSNLNKIAGGGSSAMNTSYDIEHNAYYTYLFSPEYLKKGTNIISSQLHQTGRGTLMVFDLELQGLIKK